MVSETGSDDNPGTVQAPFLTLEAARDAIRGLKVAGELPSGGVEVLIRGGVYSRNTSFELKAQDSGTAGSPIVYRSWPGEEVILFAGKIVPPTNWQALSTAAASRVHPSVNSAALRELDYDALGISNGDYLNASSQSTGAPATFALFANGNRQTMSRWPNADEKVTVNNDPGWATPNGTRDNWSFYFGGGGQPRNNDFTNELDFDGTNRSTRWKNRIDGGYDLWLRGHWRTTWAPRLSLVEDMSLEEQWIELMDIPNGGMGSKYTGTYISYDGKAYRTGDGFERWYALNMIEEIDQPGEFAIDFVDRRVYYYPDGDLGSQIIAIADSKSDHILMESVEHVTIANLSFEGGLANGVSAVQSSHIGVLGCSFDSVGHHGVYVNGGTHNLIHGNDILKAGAAGLVVHGVGDAATLTPSHTVISNNHIGYPCRLLIGSAGIGVYGVGITFRNNLIHHTTSAGMGHTGNNNLFEYNEFHNCALETGDTGATYTTQNWESYGNIFRYNFIHHNRRSNGFYCDDGDSGDFHYKNILHNCIDALKFGGGHDNIAENNLLIQNGGQRIDDRGASRGYTIGSRWEDRLNAMNPLEEPWLSYGVQLKQDHNLTTDLWSDVLDPAWNPQYPNGSRYKDNVTVESDGWRYPTGASGVRVVFEGNEEVGSVEAAGFMDFDNMDLRTSNPTILAKFPELNTVFPLMGLQVDNVRTSVPSRADVGGLENFGAAFTGGEDEDVGGPNEGPDPNRIFVDPTKQQYRYDFGPEGAETEAGWTLVTPQVSGDVFWTGDAVQAEDQGLSETVDNLNRDIISGTGATSFHHKLANGRWRVALVMGERNRSHWGMVVKAEGQFTIFNLATAAGEFKYIDATGGTTTPSYFEVDVTDGQLDMQIYRQATPPWAITQLMLTKIDPVETVDLSSTSYRYDFGTFESIVAPGWELVTPESTGDIFWSGSPTFAEDQGGSDTVNDLNRDVIMGSGTTSLHHKLSPGRWRVALVMGDRSRNHYGMVVKAEGQFNQFNIATAVGEFKYIDASGGTNTPSYFEVDVTDGQLDLQLYRYATPPWAITQLEITKVTTFTTVDLNQDVYHYDFGPIDSKSQPGWQVVSPNTSGDIYWSGAELNASDHGRSVFIDHLNRDLIHTLAPAEFNHKIANGTWRVELVMGEKTLNHWAMGVTAEGQRIGGNISTGTAEFKYIDDAGGSAAGTSFDVHVDDGELNLGFGSGSGYRHWAITQLRLEKRAGDWTLDEDQNGQIDGIDYLIGSTKADPVQLPQAFLASDGNAWWSIGVDTKAKAAWQIEKSENMVDWSPVDKSNAQHLFVDPDTGTIHANLSEASGTAPRAFYRLRVERP